MFRMYPRCLKKKKSFTRCKKVVSLTSTRFFLCRRNYLKMYSRSKISQLHSNTFGLLTPFSYNRAKKRVMFHEVGLKYYKYLVRFVSRQRKVLRYFRRYSVGISSYILSNAICSIKGLLLLYKKRKRLTNVHNYYYMHNIKYFWPHNKLQFLYSFGLYRQHFLLRLSLGGTMANLFFKVLSYVFRRYLIIWRQLFFDRCFDKRQFYSSIQQKIKEDKKKAVLVLATEERKNSIEFFGVNFYGASLFSLYIRLLFSDKERFCSARRFLHFYSFFFGGLRTGWETIFLSFLLQNFINKLMFFGKKSIIESLLFSLLISLKFFSGVLVTPLLINAVMSIRLVLVRTLVYLSGRGHVIPTPSVFDKQYKLSLRHILQHIRKRGYIRDVFKKSFANGRLIGRRVPLYKRFIKVGSLLVRTQNFFVLPSSSKKNLNLRFLKNDLFSVVRKNLYMFLLQRTYMQYRWR